MDNAKKAALAAIDEKNELIAEVADSIWGYAELSMQEVKSVAALFVKVLKEEGFHGGGGHLRHPHRLLRAPTAAASRSSAFWRSTTPCPACPRRRAAPSARSWSRAASGHGCGHNLLGAGRHGRRRRP